MKKSLSSRIVLTWMAVVCLGTWSWAAEETPAGGLVVRLGCADARALLALRVSENVIVHGLDVDPRIVEAVQSVMSF